MLILYDRMWSNFVDVSDNTIVVMGELKDNHGVDTVLWKRFEIIKFVWNFFARLFYCHDTKTYSTLQVYQRSYCQVGHIPPKMSDKFESQHSLSPTIWSDIVVGRENGYLKIFFTFLEGNMSNILWSTRICKSTFFPVCRMCGYVNTLVYFYLAPYSRQER